MGREFREGDLVVYPSHGAGVVTGTEEKTVLGEVRKYYRVYISDAGLTLSVPADGSNLRPCADEASIEEALDMLGREVTEMPSNWSHRLKHNQEKIKSGELLEVAEVVRNLSVYSREHDLSTGERSTLMRARQILVSEIAAVRGLELPEAERLVNRALKGGGAAG
ncbi:CarD family transcriptional regulator [Rubrobacter taiwanensis]|uniref:CarD family transcriptional regulator n=1 Tax=Rubrobacter taiwanensis TaxID=185139 RepID=A0A4R1BG90_9ACTN|nr:CarD family transcriptional regulator [Rubrobacter taiwanensis]TCJ16236.1 CarD family transcriptional regulator [Rubrobacter taiwanensis]